MTQMADNMNLPHLANASAEAGPPRNDGLDIIQVLWRWKWLPILGAIIGSGLGYLYFTKQPELFRAEALVQVAKSLPSTSRVEIYDPNEIIGTKNRADESMIIRSEIVLEKAVASGRLTDLGNFQGLTVDEVVGILVGTKDLVVEPAAKDASTTLIHISYVCHDRELAADVVNAIVEGYGEYLSEEYQSIGNEVYEVLTDAQKKLEKEYEDLNQKMLELQASAPDVIWTHDGATDPYADYFQVVGSELLQNELRQKRLSGTLQHIASAIEAGRSAETILLMLQTYDDASILDFQSIQSQKQNARRRLEGPTSLENRLDTASSQLERGELFRLRMRELELMDSVGEGHPTLALTRRQIKELEKQLQEIRVKEKLLVDEQNDRLKKEYEEQVLPEAVTVEQRLEIRRQAMIEELASIELQASQLRQMADTYKGKSKELQSVLNKNIFVTSKLDSIQTLLNSYTDKIQEIEIMPQTGKRTLKELNLPKTGSFYGPLIFPYVLGGAAIGFMLLAGLAVLMDLADRSYRNPEEIANDLNVPVLGHIPVMDISKQKKSVPEVDGSISTIHHSKGRVAEAYRSVRTGLYFSQYGRNLKVVQVTSPVPGDGKSTLSANLAVSMAQSGRRVLLIDADFRRPRIAKIFGIDSNVGIASVIAGQAEVDDAIHQGPVANLSVMPGGKRPGNPAELLSSQRFADLIDMLREKFDFIVIDTPPLLAVSDPGAVAGVVDGVVLTMRLRRNVKPLAMRAASILEGVGAQCLGVVVNGVSSEAGYGYNYDYNDYRYAYKYGSNYRAGYGYRYGYGNYRYGYSSNHEDDLSAALTQPRENSGDE
ncbi:MAG: polysaccharide biosynthesis tyrosine autokinase [Planctomycetota bacterium]